MGSYVAHEVVKLMIKKDGKVKNGNALVLGITFKENCPDIRNSKAIDVISELKNYNLNVDVFDPWANKEEVQHEFGISLISEEKELKENYDAIILTVSHQEFLDFNINKYTSETSVVFDVKAFLPEDEVDGRL